MNKKISIIILFLLLVSLLLSGCTEEKTSEEEKSYSSNNLAPIGVITTQEKAYFEETIEFSASESYDTDGEIISYNWDFGDDKNAEGEVVKHIYKFENNFTIDYPLIYTVYLFIQDNEGYVTAITNQIKLYPKKYLFYLNSQKLVSEIPASGLDKVRGSGLLNIGSPQELTYELENSIKVQECSWNATLYLEKPFFSVLNKISIIFYDDQDNEIKNKEEKLRPRSLWRQKTVILDGTLDTNVEFGSIKISVFGFSLGKRISILYGGEKASHICFNFTD